MSLIIIAALFSAVALMCLVLSYTFFKSRNGVLRKIMMIYFLTRALTLLFALYYIFNPIMNAGIFRMASIIPELLAMARILYWLKYKK